MDTSSGNESVVSASPRANLATTSEDDDKDDSVDSLAAHAARMYSSLKDSAVDCLVPTIAFSN